MSAPDGPVLHTGTCGKCFRERPVASCCPTHEIDVCGECYRAHVADPIRCDLFVRAASQTSTGVDDLPADRAASPSAQQRTVPTTPEQP